MGIGRWAWRRVSVSCKRAATTAGVKKMITQSKTGMSATSSSTKMKMWDQEELLRCWVGERKHKIDFGETKPIFPQAQETKIHLSVMTILFLKANPSSPELNVHFFGGQAILTAAAFQAA
jgi:hypothetical protein